MTMIAQSDDAYDTDAKFLLSVMSSSGDCIKVLDLDANLIYMSTGGQAVMEISDFNEVRGCPWPDFWKGAGNADALAAVAAAKAGGIGRFTGAADTFKGTPRYWDVQITPILGNDGKPERLLSVSRDITAHHQAELQLRASEERLNLALKAGRLGFWELDLRTGSMDASALCKANFGRSPNEPFTYDDLKQAVHPDDRQLRDDAVANAINTGEDLDVRYRLIRPDGVERWLLVQAKMQRGFDGTPLSLAGVSLDITDLKSNEALSELLNQELSHRIKNQLAVVQSIVNQSLRNAEDISAARVLITGRLEALNLAHGLLTGGASETTSMRALVETATDMHRAQVSQFIIDGPNLAVGPKAALSLALILHELTTNAVKYGGLSVPDGGVNISWRSDWPDAGCYELAWVEYGGPKSAVPTRKGFGTRLIQGGIGGDSGDVSIEFAPEGLRVRFTGSLQSLAFSK